jgi:trk/ktr system potassium uptake protein
MVRRERNTAAARLVGACALGLVADVAVDMPAGYFGGVDRITPFGWAYAAGLLLATAYLVSALRRGSRLAGWLIPLLLSINVGLFVAPLGVDPVIAGLVIVWNLTLLAQHFFPTAAEPPPPVRAGLPPLGEWLTLSSPALRHLAATSLVLTAAVVGYHLSGRLLAQLVCLALNWGTLAFAWPFLRLLYRSGSRAVLLVAVPLAASLLAVLSPAVMLSLLAVAQSVVLLLLLGQQQSTLEVLRDFFDRPSRLIVISFASVILIGTVLLTFPAAANGEAVAPLDALFTATSATCVTGLIVLDTPKAYSTFGHAVILCLIQVGGLGIMVLSTFAALLLGGSLGLKGERALTEMLDLQTASTAYRLTRFIVLATFAIEAVGAAGLAACFAAAGSSPGTALWRGGFHAVSAFCNAGFSLQSDSVVLFQGHPAALLLFALLITLGGLGFVVLSGIWNRFFGANPRPFSSQVKAVLAASATLVVAGTALYAACEWRRSLAGLGAGDKVVNALFESVTLRTAGFNSVSFAPLAPATVLFMVLFMFVGASPGSTGGGIKTTTAVVLLAAIRSTIRSSEPVKLFDREVPREIVYRSLAITVISATAVALALFFLLIFEPQPFADLLFEVVSAFGTVGLSLGATSKLGALGKLIIIAVMFIGRIGPLTLALLLGTRGATTPVCRYPQTRLMVG